MSYYPLLKHIQPNIKTIIEAGSRDGIDALYLLNIFSESTVHSFEQNPLMFDTCMQNINNHNRIKFNPVGLGHKTDILPFYAFTHNLDSGPSSFLKRIDFSETQKYVGDIYLTTLNNYMQQNGIDFIDLLCMDVQGFELNILKGCDMKKINNIILEMPKIHIEEKYLPKGIHSNYIGAPKCTELEDYFLLNNFKKIETCFENHLEDNVLYKNIDYL